MPANPLHREALITLAETFDSARIQANALPETEWQRHAYGDAAAGLEKVLALLAPSTQAAGYAYQAILDCSTVREALRHTERDFPAMAEDAAQAAIDAALALPATITEARATYDRELRGDGNILGFA